VSGVICCRVGLNNTVIENRTTCLVENVLGVCSVVGCVGLVLRLVKFQLSAFI